MYTLKIKLNPYKDINIASLENKPLSPYSELINYLKEPFLKWADKLMDAAEKEINDDYKLVVMAEEFETKFLKDMQNNFDACKEYATEKFKIPYSIEERYKIILQLLQRYNLQFSTEAFRLPVYTEVQLPLNEEMMVLSTLDMATLIVTENRELVNQIANKSGMVIVVLLSNSSKVSSLGDMKYLWEIDSGRLNEVLNCIVDRFVKIPMIVEAVNMLKKQVDSLSEEDAEKLSLVTEIDMFVTVSDIGDMEVGNTTELKIRTIPDCEELPDFRVVTSNPGILAVDGITLKALAPGKVNIEIYKAEENIPFAKKSINVYHNNLVREIQLGLNEPKMGIGRTQKINITLFPEDAEDARQIKWEVDNNAIATIDDNGNVMALSEGRATVTASTARAQGKIDIEVLPKISSINLSVSCCNLYVGQTQPIEVTVVPSNCYDSTYEWKTSDKTVAMVDKLDDGSTVIRATGIGNCVLTCIAKDGGCSATCSVNDEATFKKRENMHGMLSVSFICAVVELFCASSGFFYGVIGAAVATILFGLLAIVRNKSDVLWAFLIMTAAILIITENMGITNIL